MDNYSSDKNLRIYNYNFLALKSKNNCQFLMEHTFFPNLNKIHLYNTHNHHLSLN